MPPPGSPRAGRSNRQILGILPERLRKSEPSNYRVSTKTWVKPSRTSELRRFGAASHRQRRARSARDHLRHRVEVAGADLALVPGGGVAVRLQVELALLQPHVGGHALLGVAAGELEHGGVERVEAGQGDELEAVPHRA